MGERIPENKMGTMPVGKLLADMAIPMMISMLVQALYNIVDSVFVSRICEQALTAVSLAFPAQNLMIGLATGTAVGVNALMGRALGNNMINLMAYDEIKEVLAELVQIAEKYRRDFLPGEFHTLEILETL